MDRPVVEEVGFVAGDRLFLRLFGGFDIRRPDGGSLTLPGRRERILLAYLALQPDRRRSRRALTEFLWGEAADETTLDNLRTCLWSLRKALGDDADAVIVSDREWIGINPDALDVDAWIFSRLPAGSGPADLEKALDLYNGDLLDGMEIASDAFSDWLRDEQMRYRDIAVEALQRLMALRAIDGDHNGATEAGQRILRIEPFHEETLRALLPIYAATGRRHLVLQTYRAFAERLEKELGVEPEAETQRVLEETLNGRTPPDASQNGAPAATADTEQAVESQQPEMRPARKSRLFPPILSRAARLALWASGGLVVAGLGALLAVGITFWRVPELAPAPLGNMILGVKYQVTPTRPSMAVLTFQGHGDADAGEFGDAISDGITSALAITSDIFVVSQSSVEIYRTQPAPPQRIAADLGVRYLLEGSVSKFDDSVTIRVGLIDTQEGGRYVSMGSYQRKVTDFFKVQREITLEVVTALQVRLTEGEQERIDLVHGTKNFDAWLLASQGEKRLRQMTPKTNLGARADYERAVALDPEYARAWRGLGWTYLIEARFGWASDRNAQLGEARRIGERAMALDQGRAAAHSLMGVVALLTEDFSAAKRLGERSVELDYNDSDGVALLAYTLSYTGEPRRAIPLVLRAIRLRPYPPRWYGWLLARCHRLAGRPEKTIEILATNDAKDARSIVPLVELAAAYSEIGARAEAQAVAAAILAAYPQFTARAWLTMPTYGDRETTERELKLLVAAGLPE